ncbi:MAG TPA: PBECR2 nuclease fold domain-containing protein [Gemmatimonadales bacterium]
MARRPSLRADADTVQIAGVVPRHIRLPGGLVGAQRTVHVTRERLLHIAARRPAWLHFCLRHIPDVLSDPDFVGQRAHGDRRRVEFVRLVGQPARWLLVSVKFLDDEREAWVNSAHPIAASYLTRRRRAGTMLEAREPRGRKGRRHHSPRGI